MIPILVVDLGAFNFVLWLTGLVVLLWIALFLFRLIQGLIGILGGAARVLMGLAAGFLGL